MTTPSPQIPQTTITTTTVVTTTGPALPGTPPTTAPPPPGVLTIDVNGEIGGDLDLYLPKAEENPSRPPWPEFYKKTTLFLIEKDFINYPHDKKVGPWARKVVLTASLLNTIEDKCKQRADLRARFTDKTIRELNKVRIFEGKLLRYRLQQQQKQKNDHPNVVIKTET